MSLFAGAELAPADPILGLTEAFRRDERTDKVNLGVGVYLDESGALPLMAAVRQAQERIVAEGAPHRYLPIDGLPAYREQVRSLALGDEALDRVATMQSLGGTGALKLGADLLRQLHPTSTVLISDPSWENHRALFTRAGFHVERYRYYDAEARMIDVDGMLDSLRRAPEGTVVVLHACCHNPTGYDLTDEQWDRVIEVLLERGLFPFVDMAYQGFGAGLEEDGGVVRKLLATGTPFLLSTSYSKTFGLYGQRTGALHAVTADADEAKRVLSQLKICARTNYSNPPTFGAKVVATVLADGELRQTWEQELQHMRERIASLRTQLVRALGEHGVDDMAFVAEQRGMFSYTGLSASQMQQLREEHGIYGTDAGRICVAAMNDDTLPRIAEAVARVRAGE